jgi:hypothetical protein
MNPLVREILGSRVEGTLGVGVSVCVLIDADRRRSIGV